MAYKKIDEASLTTVANAIRAKNGTYDKLVFPDGFAEAISNIQTGSYQRAEGTFRTNSNGAANIKCEFKPDFVLIHKNGTYTEDGDNYLMQSSISFNEDARTNGTFTTFLPDYDNYYYYWIDSTQTDTGFSVSIWSEGEESSPYSGTFNYVAIKYSDLNNTSTATYVPSVEGVEF